MSQRNPMNERYTQERKGQTRKSSASAKPKSERAATLRDPAPKTRKQKKQERQEREAKQRKRVATLNARYEDTQEYKHLRHIWWGGLITAVCCTALSFVLSTQVEFFSFIPDDIRNAAGMILMVGAYGFIIFAFYIDFSRIRKGRTAFENRALYGNSKEARAMQKQARAEERERKRAEEEQAKDGDEDQPEKPKGLLGFLKRGKSTPQVEEPKESVDTKETETPDIQEAAETEAPQENVESTEEESK